MTFVIESGLHCRRRLLFTFVALLLLREAELL